MYVVKDNELLATIFVLVLVPGEALKRTFAVTNFYVNSLISKKMRNQLNLPMHKAIIKQSLKIIYTHLLDTLRMKKIRSVPSP